MNLIRLLDAWKKYLEEYRKKLKEKGEKKKKYGKHGKHLPCKLELKYQCLFVRFHGTPVTVVLMYAKYIPIYQESL